MSQDNRIDIEITEDQHARILGYIEGLNAELLPLLQTLTVEERMELFKLGEKNLSFLHKNAEYAQQNAEMVPVFLDVPMMSRDVNANARLTGYSRQLQPLLVALDDSITLTGSEALQGAMMFYHNVKLMASNGVTKAKAIHDDLAIRFAASRRRKPKTEG